MGSMLMQGALYLSGLEVDGTRVEIVADGPGRVQARFAEPVALNGAFTLKMGRPQPTGVHAAIMAQEARRR